MKAYGLAVIVTSASVGLTRLTWPFFAPAPFAPVFGAVAISAHWGSGRAGLLAAALAAAGLAIVSPAGPPFGWTSLSLILFLTIAILGSQLIAGRNKALAALRANDAELRATLAHVRESEAKLRRAQKMEAVGQLAGGVAHDFNNVLQVTMEYTDVLILAARRRLDETAIAGSAARRARSLTRQLLAFGRRHEPRVAHVDMDATIGARDVLTRVIREDDAHDHAARAAPSWSSERPRAGRLQPGINARRAADRRRDPIAVSRATVDAA